MLFRSHQTRYTYTLHAFYAYENNETESELCICIWFDELKIFILCYSRFLLPKKSIVVTITLGFMAFSGENLDVEFLLLSFLVPDSAFLISY